MVIIYGSGGGVLARIIQFFQKIVSLSFTELITLEPNKQTNKKLIVYAQNKRYSSDLFDIRIIAIKYIVLHKDNSNKKQISI